MKPAGIISRFVRRAGFSLIELLMVLAIVSIMTVFAVLGFKNIATSRGVSQAASDVLGVLEYARSEAVTRRSYVWVGLKETNVNGSLELQIAAAYSIDGTTNGGTNIAPLSRLVRTPSAGLVAYSQLKQDTKNLLGASNAVSEFTSNSLGLSVKIGQTQFTNTITFTPRGEAMLNGTPAAFDGFDPLIGIGFLPARGQTKPPSPDDAAVVLDGSTGMARILRL